MLSTLTLLCAISLHGAPTVESICLQVAPMNIGEKWKRTPNQMRAVVLVHGFHLRINEKSVPKADLRYWQHAEMALPKELGKHADVFSFAYGQNVALETVLKESQLARNIAQLRKAGYSEIVLIGHSAGGLLARHFVEDHPDAGVTKVLQVCSPNVGSPFAIVPAPKNQRVFLECLTEENCRKRLEARADKMIPKHVEFVCIIGRIGGTADSDGIVRCASQWSSDLQKQGIPVVCISGSHAEMMRDARIAVTFANLLCEKHQRWPVERIEKTKKEVFGNRPD
jgi:pimeloyl-ACP methyl ester carboxylesterase